MTNRNTFVEQHTGSDAATNALVFMAGFAIGAIVCLLLAPDKDDENLFDEKESARGKDTPETYTANEMQGTQPDQALTSFFGDVVIQPS